MATRPLWGATCELKLKTQPTQVGLRMLPNYAFVIVGVGGTYLGSGVSASAQLPAHWSPLL